MTFTLLLLLMLTSHNMHGVVVLTLACECREQQRKARRQLKRGQAKLIRKLLRYSSSILLHFIYCVLSTKLVYSYWKV
jgi:hypothetical protein